MTINIDEKNLKQGVMGLVLALVEIIRDALRLQAIRRIESGRLTDEEIERLGSALADLDRAIEQIIEEQGITEAVYNVRNGLDHLANDMINKMIHPEEGEKVSQRNRYALKPIQTP